MALVLPIARRIPMMVLGLLAFGVYLLAFPPRRRVLFDRAARVIRIDHAGMFQERSKRSIRFDDVEAIELESVGRRRVDAIARTRTGDVYLCTMLDRGGRGEDGRAREGAARRVTHDLCGSG